MADFSKSDNSADETGSDFTPEPAAVSQNRSQFGGAGIIALLALAFMIWDANRKDGKLLADLAHTLTSAWLLISLAVLYCLIIWAINAGLDAPDSRKWIATALQRYRGGELYRSLLRHALDWIDAKLSWEEQARGLPAQHWAMAWSPRMFETCLLMALFYPLYSVFAIWAVTNAPGTIGELTIVPGGQSPWIRIATIGGLVGALAFGQLSKRRRAQGKVAEAHLYLGLAAVAAPFAASSKRGDCSAALLTEPDMRTTHPAPWTDISELQR